MKGFLLLVRGIPGSGKTNLVDEFVKNTDPSDFIRLNPDKVETNSSNFIEFCNRIKCSIPLKKKIYRYLLYRACEYLALGKVVIWEQPWRSVELLIMTLENICVIGYELHNPKITETNLPFYIGIVDIHIPDNIARERVAKRFLEGLHPLPPEGIEEFIGSVEPIENIDLPKLILDGEESVYKLNITMKEFVKKITKNGPRFIYLIRHLSTTYNKNGIYMGRSNDLSIIPETILSFKDSIKKYALDTRNPYVVTSPALRCIETTNVLLETLGISNITEICSQLHEVNYGDFEGKTSQSIKENYPTEYKMWMEYPSQVYFPNGESFTQVQDRVINYLTTMLSEHNIETLFIITHVDIIKIIISWILGTSIDNKRMFRIDNGSITCLETTDEKYNRKKIKVKYLNGI